MILFQQCCSANCCETIGHNYDDIPGYASKAITSLGFCLVEISYNHVLILANNFFLSYTYHNNKSLWTQAHNPILLQDIYPRAIVQKGIAASKFNADLSHLLEDSIFFRNAIFSDRQKTISRQWIQSQAPDRLIASI
jgi:hypothetical protein